MANVSFKENEFELNVSQTQGAQKSTNDVVEKLYIFAWDDRGLTVKN